MELTELLDVSSAPAVVVFVTVTGSAEGGDSEVPSPAVDLSLDSAMLSVDEDAVEVVVSVAVIGPVEVEGTKLLDVSSLAAVVVSVIAAAEEVDSELLSPAVEASLVLASDSADVSSAPEVVVIVTVISSAEVVGSELLSTAVEVSVVVASALSMELDDSAGVSSVLTVVVSITVTGGWENSERVSPAVEDPLAAASLLASVDIENFVDVSSAPMVVVSVTVTGSAEVSGREVLAPGAKTSVVVTSALENVSTVPRLVIVVTTEKPDSELIPLAIATTLVSVELDGLVVVSPVPAVAVSVTVTGSAEDSNPELLSLIVASVLDSVELEDSADVSTTPGVTSVTVTGTAEDSDSNLLSWAVDDSADVSSGTAVIVSVTVTGSAVEADPELLSALNGSLVRVELEDSATVSSMPVVAVSVTITGPAEVPPPPVVSALVSAELVDPAFVSSAPAAVVSVIAVAEVMPVSGGPLVKLDPTELASSEANALELSDGVEVSPVAIVVVTVTGTALEDEPELASVAVNTRGSVELSSSSDAEVVTNMVDVCLVRIVVSVTVTGTGLEDNPELASAEVDARGSVELPSSADAEADSLELSGVVDASAVPMVFVTVTRTGLEDDPELASVAVGASDSVDLPSSADAEVDTIEELSGVADVSPVPAVVVSVTVTGTGLEDEPELRSVAADDCSAESNPLVLSDGAKVSPVAVAVVVSVTVAADCLENDSAMLSSEVELVSSTDKEDNRSEPPDEVDVSSEPVAVIVSATA